MEIFWDQVERSEWERFADLAHAPMQQRWTYGAVHAGLGGQTHRAIIKINGQPVAICQSLTRKIGGVLSLTLATRGPLFLGDCDQMAALRLIKRTHPALHPRLHLFTLANHVPNWRLIPLMTPATNAILPLPTLRRNLHGKWRNALKKTEYSKLIITQSACEPATLANILAQDSKAQINKSYRALPPAFSLAWQQIAPQEMRLFTAHEGGQTIASALFLLHGNTASYHIAHTSPRGRDVSAARAILWQAFQDLAAADVTQIDLGVIDTENAAGLARFKLGTGAKAVQGGPTILAS